MLPISVVIPTFRRSETLADLLGDLSRQEGIEFEVIVVDDCSPENPVPELRNRFPQVQVLRNDVNSGPAVARNRGIRAARGAIVVGFDNDVRIPDAGTLAKIARRLAEEPTIDGLALRLLAADGRSEDRARWWHPRPIESFAGRTFPTSYFSGTAYAFRREPLLKAGLFPEIFFMHYEEVELAYRLIDGGATIVYCPEIAVIHHAHPVSRRSEISRFYKPRNQLLVAARCFPASKAVAYIVPRLVYQFSVAVRHGHVRSFCRALRSAAGKLPECARARRVLQPATLRRIAALRSVATL